MGGHVESGETYDEAFARELYEELNIYAAKTPWKLLDKMSPDPDGVSCFMHVYTLSADIAPNYSTDDYMSFEWLSPKELLERVANGEKVKSDLPIVVRKFFE
jgi:8-oxo-dGTP pyrophosphatase MutT (NUDIX family)